MISPHQPPDVRDEMDTAEDEREQQHQIPAIPLHVVSLNIPSISMITTLEEQLRALEIKIAVGANVNSNLSPLSDMEYVQHALVAEGDLQAAVAKITGLQEFRSYYQVNNTVEQGMHYIERLFQLHPGFCLHLALDEARHEVTRVMDMGAFDPQAATSQANGKDYNWKSTIVGMYYLYLCCQPSLGTIRNGVLEVLDCEEFGWKSFNEDMEHQMFEELRRHLPIQFQSILLYNTGPEATTCWNLLKHYINDNRKDVVKLGCQVTRQDGSRVTQPLNSIFWRPTREESEANLLQQIRTLLELRFENEQAFML